MAEDLVIPTIIEGRMSSAWAAEAMAHTLQQAEVPTACEPDASGRVVMLAGTGIECVVTDEQMIFVPIVAKSCTIDDRLPRRAQRATGPRQDRLWSRVTAQESFMFRCLYADLQALQGAYLAVDGLESVVDATLFIISDPITVDGTTYRWPGYYAMTTPLPPGQHLIVTGHEAIPGSPLRTSTTVDVVEAP